MKSMALPGLDLVYLALASLSSHSSESGLANTGVSVTILHCET